MKQKEEITIQTLADNEDIQNLIAGAFMKSAEIRNKLSYKKDPQPIADKEI